MYQSGECSVQKVLESNAAEVAETKYLLACACLELLTDRHAKQGDEEFILDRPTFRELYREMKEKMALWATGRGVPEPKRKLMAQSLLGLNRPSFKSKIEALLEQWEVKHDDIHLDLQTPHLRLGSTTT